MALLEYFPNYVWNLSVAIAIESGGRIGEIEDICRPLARAVERGEKVGTADFVERWLAMGDRLIELAAEDEERGRLLSAAAKLQRAALYLLVGERSQGHGSSRVETFAKAQRAFRKAIEMGKENCERVEIPYEQAYLPGLFVRALGTAGPAPCVLYVNGLDSCKEMLYWSGLAQALAVRGISTLCVDQPGTGESIRLHGFHATHEAERWATPCYEWLAARDDVLPDRVGVIGISLGGYFAPRAAAFEPRFAAGVSWGANHNWAEVQRRRLQREGENPVPQYWDHVKWVFGATSMEDFLEKSRNMHLNGVLDRIRVPFLVTHGARDRQIPLEYAHQTYEQLVNSPRRELKVFTEREGGVEHVGADNMSFARDYIADWFAEVLGGKTA
ncbi:MAG: prolyl oligopeptidase family serine peptidase [Gammaproteobacteria bacterium]|nr:alpha/beta hydrolase [Gammaproteobacteria bacterium]